MRLVDRVDCSWHGYGRRNLGTCAVAGRHMERQGCPRRAGPRQVARLRARAMWVCGEAAEGAGEAWVRLQAVGRFPL